MKIQVIGNTPRAMSSGANGMDVVAAHQVIIPAGAVRLVPTGTRLQIVNNAAEGDEIAIATLNLPRSSLAKSGLMLANSVGLIDTDYQGDVGFMFFNRTEDAITINAGDRIGQMLFVLSVFPQAIEFEQVEEFTTVTARGEGAYGSTGETINA